MAEPDAEETASEWLARPERDCEVARDLCELAHWDYASFASQQAAEKALKAVHIHRHNRLERTHDLLRLARGLKAERAIEEKVAFLGRFYVASRYPDEGGEVSERDARKSVTLAREVVSWARTQLS